MEVIDHVFRPRQWSLAHGQSLQLGPKSVLMGVLNITPDSFSDPCANLAAQAALSTANDMILQNTQILDVGGESTRPGSAPISAREEQDRVAPVIDSLCEHTDRLISIDTYRATTAQKAIEAGAHIVNDIWGFQKDKDMAKIVADYGAGVCLMHNGRDRPRPDDMFRDQINWFKRSIEIAKQAGIDDAQIVLDPGFGFAKDVEQNLELMAHMGVLHDLGYPLLVGTSRKRFIGALTGRDVGERDIGTAATSVYLRLLGAAIFRVHDVKANGDALNVVDAVIAQRLEMGIKHYG